MTQGSSFPAKSSKHHRRTENRPIPTVRIHIMSAATAILPIPTTRVSPSGPGATGPSGTEHEVRMHALRIAQAAIEVLAGTRPVQQLSRSLDPKSLTSLQHRAALTRAHALRTGNGHSRHHRNPQVRSVHICAVTESVYEAAMVVNEELRSRAVAMRLELSNGAWKVTALEIG